MQRQKGFSLIELFIVVVIIGIIAAIAIPNLLAARRAQNESAAMLTVREMIKSEADFISGVEKDGYVFSLDRDRSRGRVEVVAIPKTLYPDDSYTGTGAYSYYLNETGTVHREVGRNPPRPSIQARDEIGGEYLSETPGKAEWKKRY